MIDTVIENKYGVSLADFATISARSTAMLEAARKISTAPHPVKAAPTFSLSQIADMCGIPKARASYYIAEKSELIPSGTLPGGNRKREFTLKEARQWIKFFAPHATRPAGADAIKIACANFKGGVTKTTTTVSTAQGLSLLGLTVLIVDLDPQGSATVLSGLRPDQEVTEEETIFPLVDGTEDTLEYAVQPTYWDGIDVIPAAIAMYGAEFLLPSKQIKNPDFEFWNVINKGIEPLLKKYDVILFDTPPSLSYMTINAMLAADAIIIPMPPSALDFASSTQFWSLMAELTEGMVKRKPALANKRFDFVSILMAKTTPLRIADSNIKDLVRETYGRLVLEVEIPESAAVHTAAMEFGTIYDDTSAMLSGKTYQRARESLNHLVLAIHQKIVIAWSKKNGS